MGKFVNKLDYERFVLSLKGPLESLNGEIYEATSDTLNIFGCYLNIVIHETQVQPDIISTLMTELANKFTPMYDEYMDEKSSGMGGTMVRIRNLIITGGLEGLIGINLNDSMSSVLPIEKLQWTKEVRTVKDLIGYSKDTGILQLMTLDETTLDRLNRSLKQLQSQKNVPHNLQVHLDFIEEGTFTMPDAVNLNMVDGDIEQVKVYYRFPDNIKLNFKCDPRNHNKITGEVDFNWKPIYVEYPKLTEDFKTGKRDALISLLTNRIKHILKSNDLTPVNFAGNSGNYDRALFNFKFKWTG